MAVSLSQLKQELGVTGNTDDAQLLRLIQSTAAAVKDFLGYDPDPGSAVEYYGGDDTAVVTLRRKPVLAVTLVEYDERGHFGATGQFTADPLVAGTDYVVETKTDGTALIRRLDSVWPSAYQWGRTPLAPRLAPRLVPGLGSVRVTYTVDCPADPRIDAALYAEAKALWAMRLNGVGMQNSESFDGRSVSLTPFSLGGGSYGGAAGRARFASPVAELMLAPLQRIAFGGGW